MRRGETGQWGVLSPWLFDLCGLGTRVESAGVGWSWGVFADARARWMAAADGAVVVWLARAEGRFGLPSWLLFFLDLWTRRAGPAMAGVWRWGWDEREGEGSREDMGEFVCECVAVGRGGAPLDERSEVWAGVIGFVVAPVAPGVFAAGGALSSAADAGSAVSGRPVTERKPSSWSVMVGSGSAWGHCKVLGVGAGAVEVAVEQWAVRCH